MTYLSAINFTNLSTNIGRAGFASNLQRKLKLALYKANITSKNVLALRITMSYLFAIYLIKPSITSGGRDLKVIFAVKQSKPYILYKANYYFQKCISPPYYDDLFICYKLHQFVNQHREGGICK